MKLKTLHHDASTFAVARPGGMTPVVRSSASHLHPLLIERERQRALNAVKLERMFAKPLVAAMAGHTDGISTLARCRTSLAPIISGAYDGELIVWSAGTKQPVLRKAGAHTGAVKGVTTSLDDRLIFSGGDRKIFAWDLDLERFAYGMSVDDAKEEAATGRTAGPLSVRHGYETTHGAISCLDAHWSVHEFACGSGGVVELFDPQRSKAKTSLEGSESIIAAKYNPSEAYLIAASTQSGWVLLYDTRTSAAVSRLQLRGRGNGLSWNPREPMNLGIASEDMNGYMFDIRKLDEARQVYKGHVGAVMSIDWSPLGKEVVLGSYDKTVRIYKSWEEKAREVYFTKRMQRISGVCYSGDGRYIFSASEDMNVRIWKTRASEKLGVISEREKKAMGYRDKLKDKFKGDEEIAKISKFRYVPKFIKNQGKQRSEMFASHKRKDDNKEKNQKGFVKEGDKKKIVRSADI
jgi:WD repeat and SOF domain-containing protein 1